MTPTFLADTSAWHRSGASAAVYERWSGLLMDGRLGTCSPVRLEILYSARGPTDYATLDHDLQQLPQLRFDSRSMERARAVQASLAARSRHRGPTPADLYIAAIAEVNDVVLLHYDRHFDAIAAITGQPTEWIARRGTLD